MPKIPSKVKVEHDLRISGSVWVNVEGLERLKPIPQTIVIRLPKDFTLDLPTDYTGRIGGRVTVDER